MPLLQFDTTVEMASEEKRRFADEVRESYAEIMRTGTGHVAVVVRPRSPAELSVGRASDDDRLLFLDADVRAGRPVDLKREFALAVMDLAAAEFGVPTPNMKVVFTEHEGRSMMGYDRVWDRTGIPGRRGADGGRRVPRPPEGGPTARPFGTRQVNAATPARPAGGARR